MDENEDYFWPSYVDFMTSIFFVMLVLFVLSFFLLSNQKRVMQEKLDFLEDVENTLEGLSKDTSIFRYEEEFKRYKLAQKIEFKMNKHNIDENSVKNYDLTKDQLMETGRYLKDILDTLQQKKQTDSRYEDISYLMIITGMASQEGEVDHNYHLSYSRAYALYLFWKNEIVDFDIDYREIVDLQISGVGEGGIGRDEIDDEKNRSFFIQIIPKIGAFE